MDISKVKVYEFWYDCITENYHDHAKLRYRDTQMALSSIWKQNMFSNILKNSPEDIQIFVLFFLLTLEIGSIRKLWLILKILMS